MRQIILDTETTGLEPEDGHRVIEIGALEMEDRKLTGRNFHCYLNPEREIDDGAMEVHGITLEFLRDKPHFADVAAEFVEFVRGAELVDLTADVGVGGGWFGSRLTGGGFGGQYIQSAARRSRQSHSDSPHTWRRTTRGHGDGSSRV